MKTRATTAKKTARTSIDFLILKSKKLPASKLSRVDEEQFEWENEDLPPLMNPSQLQEEYQNEYPSKRTPLVPLTKSKECWLGKKQ